MMAIITIVIKKIEKSEHGKNSNQSKPLYMHYKARKKLEISQKNNIHKVIVVETYITNSRKKLIL